MKIMSSVRKGDSMPPLVSRLKGDTSILKTGTLNLWGAFRNILLLPIWASRRRPSAVYDVFPVKNNRFVIICHRFPPSAGPTFMEIAKYWTTGSLSPCSARQDIREVLWFEPCRPAHHSRYAR